MAENSAIPAWKMPAYWGIDSQVDSLFFDAIQQFSNVKWTLSHHAYPSIRLDPPHYEIASCWGDCTNIFSCWIVAEYGKSHDRAKHHCH